LGNEKKPTFYKLIVPLISVCIEHVTFHPFMYVEIEMLITFNRMPGENYLNNSENKQRECCVFDAVSSQRKCVYICSIYPRQLLINEIDRFCRVNIHISLLHIVKQSKVLWINIQLKTNSL
jgi:hypothetical protein